MDSTSLSLKFPELPWSQRECLLKDAALVSVWQIFATIPDPRRRQGLRYDLAYLLTCLVAAMLCNRNSTDIVSFSKGCGPAASPRRERGKSATKTCDSIWHEDAEFGGREPLLPQRCSQRKEPGEICAAVDD